MPDRNDASQYPQQTTGLEWYGDATMDDVQLQTQPNGSYATPEQMTDYVAPGTVNDILADRPGEFLTLPSGKKTRIDYYPGPLTQNGGIVRTGPGMLRGYSIMHNTTAQPVTVAFYDGSDANAPMILAHSVIPAASGPVALTQFFPAALRFKNGLYVAYLPNTPLVAGLTVFVESEIPV